VGQRLFRGGIDWDEVASTVVFEAGFPGAGGDAVYKGQLCNQNDPGAPDHICSIEQVETPGGDSWDWASVAVRPFVNHEGTQTFYASRTNWTQFRAVQEDLSTGQQVTLHAWNDSNGTIYGIFNDQVFVGAPSTAQAGEWALWACTMDKAEDCREVHTAPRGDFDVIVVADHLIRP
jgi:hypothetical protein